MANCRVIIFEAISALAGIFTQIVKNVVIFSPICFNWRMLYHCQWSRPQTTRLHPALHCAAVSIFLQLYLNPAVHISCSRSLFHVFLGRSLPLRPCGVHCITCTALLSSLLLNAWSSQFHFLLHVCALVLRQFSFTTLYWIFCLVSVYI